MAALGAPDEVGLMSTSGTRAATTRHVMMRDLVLQGTGTGNVSGSAESEAASETKNGTVGVQGPGTGEGAPEAGRRRSGDAHEREVRTRTVSESAAAAGAESELGESGSARRSLGAGRALSPQRQAMHPLMMAPWGSLAPMDLMPQRRRAGIGTVTGAVATGGKGSGGGTGIEIVSTSEVTGVKDGTRPPVAGVVVVAAAVVRTTGSKGSGLMGGTSIWRPMLVTATWLLRMAT